MATSGIDSTTSALILAALNGQTAFTITGPLRVLFHTATRSADTGTDTEFATSAGYIQKAGSLGSNPASPLTFPSTASAGAPSTHNSNITVSVVNMPAGTWTGCSIQDSKNTSRTVTDGVTNSTTTITSATASFLASDVGAQVTGSADLPTNVVIAAVTNTTTAVLSVAATGTHSGQTFNILRLNNPQVTFWAQLGSSKVVNAGDTVTVPSSSWQTSLS